jgi:hypothetical protein
MHHFFLHFYFSFTSLESVYIVCLIIPCWDFKCCVIGGIRKFAFSYADGTWLAFEMIRDVAQIQPSFCSTKKKYIHACGKRVIHISPRVLDTRVTLKDREVVYAPCYVPSRTLGIRVVHMCTCCKIQKRTGRQVILRTSYIWGTIGINGSFTFINGSFTFSWKC